MSVNLRTRKRLLWLAALVMGAGALAVVVAGLSIPIAVDAAAAPRPHAPESAPVPDEGRPGQLTLAELEELSGTDLRRPLYDAPSSQSAGDPAAAAPVKLVGMVNEPGHSMVILQKADGSMATCAQGETLDDAPGPVTVVEIGARKVTIRCRGNVYELPVPVAP